nr:glycosyltransferase [Nocardioides panaciterrulae]
MQAQAPGWAWTVLGGDHAWVEDPREAVAGADVVLTHAGQNALAEVAALRRPAVVVPQRRPFDEQHCTAVLLAHGPWPATVLPELPENPAAGWGAVLAATARLDGGRWEQWCDGGAAARFAAVVDEVLAAAA